MNFLPNISNFADILDDDTICNSQPISIPSSQNTDHQEVFVDKYIPSYTENSRPSKRMGQQGEFRSFEEIDPKYRTIFTYRYFNLVQSRVIEDALYSDKSLVVCAPTGSGKTVIFEMAITQLLMDIEDSNYTEDFKIIYMAPVKALCTERLTEWYPKFTKLGLLCIEVTGDTDVDFPQLKPYRVIITTPEKWDMLTRRWRDYRGLVEVVKLFLIDEVHILNDDTRGPVLEAVVSRMKTIESSAKSAHRIEQLQMQYRGHQSKEDTNKPSPRIRFVAISATVSSPEDVAAWLGTADRPAVYYKFGDECRPVKLVRVVEGYPCPPGTSIFKFDIILNYKLWPIIQKYHNGKPTLIFCNTRKSVTLTADALTREVTVNFNPEQKAKLTALAATIKNKKLQALILNGVGCHHAGLLFEERMNIEYAFRNRDLPILITTTTLAMGVNLPAHLVIIKNTQQYVNGAYQEYSISTILQMVGRAGRPQYDTEATAVIMTRMADKARYQSLVGGTEPLQSFLHKRLAENLNSEAALGTVTDVAQCVQWVNSTFLSVRATKDPRRYLSLPQAAPTSEISKKIEELCVRAMNGLATAGLITMDEASCIESTEAGKLMSVYYIDLETMKLIMKIDGSETLERLLSLLCECHELSDMHLRVDERRCLNTLNRSNAAATIRYPMKGKITSRQMKLNCVIQAVLGCLPIPDPSLNQEAMKIMRIALRVCKCLVAYTTRHTSVSLLPKTFSAVLNSVVLMKCLSAGLWENSSYVSKQLRGIGPAFSTLLASAGKTNFLLLEESHPRDLERIMNKGPPAGNVIRKQISLLPKYQLSITPTDRDKVEIQLSLINLAHLSENLEEVTAGVNHRSYLIVGDSENHLLYLMSFKDTELIKIYSGCISCEVTRKHNYEHKIVAHCVSSTFAGIDVQTEYLFINIGPVYYKSDNNDNEALSKPLKTLEQKSVERKRKMNKNVDVVCSREKKTRDNNLWENIKCFKDSSRPKSTETSNKMSQKFLQLNSTMINEVYAPKSCKISKIVSKDTATKDEQVVLSDRDSLRKATVFHNVEDEELVNNILTDIEKEMDKSVANQRVQQLSLLPIHLNKNNILKYKTQSKCFRQPQKQVKSNFNFIDVLEKEIDLNKNDDDISMKYSTEGFTNTVKFQIDKYLQNAEIAQQNNKPLNVLLEIENKNLVNKIGLKSFKTTVEDKDPFLNSDCRPNKEDSVFKTVVDEKSISSPNIEIELNEEYVQITTDNKILREEGKEYNDCEKFQETYNYKEYNNLDRKATGTNHNSNCNKLMLLSSSVVIEDNKSENIDNDNENNRISDILLKRSVNSHEMDANLNILHVHDNTKCLDIKNINNTNSEVLHNFSLEESNYLHYTSSYTSVSNMLQNLDVTKFNLRDSTENQINDNIKFPVRMKNTIDHAVTSTSAFLPIVVKSNNLKSVDSHFMDTNKSCLKNLKDKLHSDHVLSISQCNEYENTIPYYKTDEKHTDCPLNANEQDSNHIEKYRFLSSKLDICTKNDSNHTVKIISKLKIDFDVTKIISTKSKTSNCKIVNVTGTCNTLNSHPELDNSDKIAQVKNIKTKCGIESTYKENTLSQSSNFDKPVPKCNELNAKRSNKLADVIQKYSQIIRKSNILEVPIMKTVKKDIITNSAENKNKRRYKISDIQNLQDIFPKKVFGDEQKRENFKKQLIENAGGHGSYLRYDPASSDNSTDISDNKLPMTPSHRPEYSYEINKDYENEIEIFNHQSKTELNPKTLLECFTSKNIKEEIIPPPPEFADIAINLSTHTHAYSPASPDYNYETYNCDVLKENFEYETNKIRSKLNNVSQADLIPPNGVDSVVFPVNTQYTQDKYNAQDCALNRRPVESYAVLRSNYINTQHTNNFHGNVKLGEFKFKGKELLKYRK